MKKIISLSMMSAAILLFALGGSSLAEGGTRIFGQIESSKVDVEVAKYVTDKNGKEVVQSGSTKSLPGGEVEGILRVINKGADCYVRIMPVLSGEGSERYKASEFLSRISDAWVQKEDDCYYYKNVLPAGGSVDFCKGVRFPKDMKSEKLKLTYEVSAIQSANLKVDLDAVSPWNSVAIEQSRQGSGGFLVDMLKGSYDNSQNLTLKYNEDAQGLISNFDEIFTDMPQMHPGDTYKETIDLYNDTDSKKTLYIRDETDKSEILDYVNVLVETNINGVKKDVFKGTIADSDEALIKVGTLDPQESGELTVTAFMDDQAGNEASALTGHVSLTMEAMDEGEVPSDSGKEGEEIVTRKVKTGDERNPTGLFLIAGALVLATFALFPRKKRK